jgi:hypothetical protein
MVEDSKEISGKSPTPKATDVVCMATATSIAQSPFGDSPAGVLLRNFVKTMNAQGKDAQEEYERALSQLRKMPEETILEIARAEKACSIDDYSTRWFLIFAATELKHPAALPLFRQIVLAPIPPERSPEPHSLSTVEEETIIRTTAVDGVRTLAEKENSDALKILFEFLTIPSLSVKRAAVQAIISVRKDQKTLNEIAEILPKDMRFLLDLKPKDVREVPQITDPQKYLEKVETEGKRRAAPKLIPDEKHSKGPRSQTTKKE